MSLMGKKPKTQFHLKKRFYLAIDKVMTDHTGAYAAQTAYFLVLSLIPLILLLLTMVQYTPVTKADVMTAVVQVFPETINVMIVSIVNQVYNQSQVMVPLTLVVAIWSAGRGVLAMSAGLNCIYDSRETRNYIYLRIRAALYTLLFLGVIAGMLLVMVFGNRLADLIMEKAQYMTHVVNFVIRTRAISAIIVLFFFSLLIYKFLPNRKNRASRQIVGALVSALGWMGISFVFSAYLDIFKGFSDMYGSLTTIVLIMLWFYFCMYITLIGGIINVVLDREMTEFNQEES